MIRFRTTWDYEGLAKRIALILVGTEEVYFHEDSQKWQIGGGNNFWLHKEGDENCYLLNMRYESAEKVSALSFVFEWLLRVELLQ